MSARATCRCGWTKTYRTLALAEGNAARHVCPTTRRVRRGTYARRCARCGWEGTYDTAGKADWAKRKHSCQKREQAMLRAAFHEKRMALIDRTPKPCLHKVANHQHGTNACYVLDGCRCEPCSEARGEQDRWRARMKAYGRYQKYVNAEHVRAHLNELGDYGIGLKQVAKLSGVSTGTLSKIMFGVYADTGTGGGRNGPGVRVREPSRRVLRRTAEAIYSVEPIPANLGAGQKDHDRTPVARLHLRALVALGWSISKIGDRLGIGRSNMGGIIHGDRIMQRGTIDKVEALFADLCMTLPPEDTKVDKIAASRSRRYAAEHGWLPPLALDDIEPCADDAPDVDEVAIQRRMDGDKAVRLTKTEAAALVARWRRSGRPLNECERVTGIPPWRHIDGEGDVA